MIITYDEGKVSIWAFQLKNHPIFTISFQRFNRSEQAFCGGGRILAHMVVERGKHIFGCHGFAIVEFNALTQVEHPSLAIGGFVAFGQLSDQLTIIANFGQVVAERIAIHKREVVFRGS